MSNIVLTDITNNNQNGAWTKVKNDVTNIMCDLKFEPVAWHNQNTAKFFRIFELFKAMILVKVKVKESNYILLQYPHHPWVVKRMISHIVRIRKKKHCKLVILIHDLCYLRGNKYPLSKTLDMKHFEIDILNQADAVIVHNKSMEETLKKASVVTPMYSLFFFDYLYKGDIAKISNSQYQNIVYAGNLSKGKSGFIYKLPNLNNVKYNLYGNNPGEFPQNCDYKGSFSPDKLIPLMEGNYGLVWDGMSSDTCEGSYGEYLRYNNPHKFSLYMAAGLPVVVWKDSALAETVKKLNIGLAVSSLEELAYLPTFESDKYKTMLKNVGDVRKRVCNGEMLKTVMQEIMRHI